MIFTPEQCEQVLSDRSLRLSTMEVADQIRSGIAVNPSDAMITIAVMDHLRGLSWHRRLILWLRSRRCSQR